MRHCKAGLKLSRTSSHRNAMFRNMVTSLFKYDRIQTTDIKARELRRWADHLITLAKRGDLHARRQAMSIVREPGVVYRLFDQAKERYGDRAGGYTRIVKIGIRPGDAAPVSMIELIGIEKYKGKSAAKKKEKKSSAADSAKVKTKSVAEEAELPQKSEE
ncbi:MAG: 50S ribosomal protein L17 [Desulfobacterales bacterium]|nr:50S ribosomal protein L17 [Desulfobacterales bacterium]MDD3081065.1 50S ribosomal protein L17 [Desulfobacterales bacterium]MDY0376865.1 50S ribosomal protein L17 [Desulfobacterales bacterium]